MSERTRWFIGFGVLILAVAASLVWHRLGEPAYSGRSLSQWLLVNKKSATPMLPAETQTAVLALGSSSIPYLERWAEYRSSRSKDWLFALIQKVKFGKLAEAEQWTRARRAVFALNCLGTEEAFESLLNVTIVQTNAAVRDFAVEMVCAELRSNPGGSFLLVVRSTTNADARIALAGVRGFSAFPAERKAAVNTLLVALHHSDAGVRGTAAQTLAFYGTDALIAAPALVIALDDPELDVRLMANYALKQIAPQSVEGAGLQQARRR